MQGASNLEGALFVQNDVYFDDYSKFATSGTCLVIDNGSHECRVGWAGEPEPRMIFPNITARPRTKLTGLEHVVAVGNEIVNMESMRASLKSQFERDVVVNLEVQSHVFNYIFSHMGVNTDRVQVPVLLTETLCNPVSCRADMTQLLFELYRVPKIAYGIDCLFSYRYNQVRTPALSSCLDCFIVNSGTHSTHIIPVLDGKVDLKHTKRINVGGAHTLNFMHKFLQLKYSQNHDSILLSKIQEVIKQHSFIATDFLEELELWKNPDKMERGSYLYQLDAVDSVDREELEKSRRKKLQLNMLTRILKDVDGKLSPLYQRMMHLQSLSEMEEESNALQFSLEREGVRSRDELYALIRDVETQVDKLKEKRTRVVDKIENIDTSPSEKDKYSEEELCELRDTRQRLLERIAKRDNLRSEISKRGSLANQQKTKLLNKLANRMDSHSASANFSDIPLDAEEKEILEVIDDATSKRDQQELEELEQLLRLHDPLFKKELHPDPPSQIHIGIERFRCPEVIFRPSMIGVDQTGIVDTIEYVLQQYPEEIQSRLIHNYFVTGGNTLYPGFSQRMRKDLTEILPIHTEFVIHMAERQDLDSWRGASWWAESNPNQGFVSVEEYQEKGADYFAEHSASNLYFPVQKNKQEMS